GALPISGEVEALQGLQQLVLQEPGNHPLPLAAGHGGHHRGVAGDSLGGDPGATPGAKGPGVAGEGSAGAGAGGGEGGHGEITSLWLQGWPMAASPPASWASLGTGAKARAITRARPLAGRWIRLA